MRLLVATLVLLWSAVAGATAPSELTVKAPDHDGGLTLELSWTLPADDGAGTVAYTVLRAQDPAGPWQIVTDLPAGSSSTRDKVTTSPSTEPPKERYHYRVVGRDAQLEVFLPPDKAEELAAATKAWVARAERVATPVVSGEPQASIFHFSLGYLLLLGIIVAVGGLMFLFTDQVRKGKEIFIRRIPGIDAIEEGIGRATEMGKPVLYVPGIDELQDIQTIASMLILGRVAEMIAEYQADLIVTCRIPIVREVADEVVRAGFYQAGFPEAFSPSMVRFISSEQFAFTAGTNGIMLREKTATNLYMGRFFAESLILGETGFVNRSIQIAGTAEATQLPFFIAACDYTLIGEELFAVSAYLSKDPRLVSSLKASDWVKVFVVVSLLLGTLLATLGYDIVLDFYTLGGG